MTLQYFSPETLTEARRRVNLPIMAALDVELKETTQGELRGPCPFCGEGDDRFVIFTQGKGGQAHNGRFKCRVCGKRGDGLQYLVYKTGQQLPSVVKTVLGADWQAPKQQENSIKPAKKKQPVNRELWQQRLEPMVYHAIDYLVNESDTGAAAAAAWLAQRGIYPAQIGAYGLGYNPGWQTVYDDYKLPPGLTMPRWGAGGWPLLSVNLYMTKENREKYGKRRFVRGSRVDVPFGGHLVNDDTTALWVAEGELDAVLLSRFLPAGHVAITYGGNECLPDDLSIFDGRAVYLVNDNDTAGENARAKWQQLLPLATVATVPTGKDVTEYWQAGGELGQWVNDFFSPMP